MNDVIIFNKGDLGSSHVSKQKTRIGNDFTFKIKVSRDYTKENNIATIVNAYTSPSTGEFTNVCLAYLESLQLEYNASGCKKCESLGKTCPKCKNIQKAKLVKAKAADEKKAEPSDQELAKALRLVEQIKNHGTEIKRSIAKKYLCGFKNLAALKKIVVALLEHYFKFTDTVDVILELLINLPFKIKIDIAAIAKLTDRNLLEHQFLSGIISPSTLIDYALRESELQDFQKQIMEKLVQILHSTDNEALLIKTPTSSGKTCIMSAFMIFSRKVQIANKLLAVYVCPTDLLAAQMLAYIYNKESKYAFYPGNENFAETNSKNPLIIITTENMLQKSLEIYKKNNARDISVDLLVFWDELTTNIPTSLMKYIADEFTKYKFIVASATLNLSSAQSAFTEVDNVGIINIEKRFVPTYVYVNSKEIDPRSILEGITGISPKIIYNAVPKICNIFGEYDSSQLGKIIGKEIPKLKLSDLLGLEREFKYPELDIFDMIGDDLGKKIEATYKILKNNHIGDNIFIFCCGYEPSYITDLLGAEIKKHIAIEYPEFDKLVLLIERKMKNTKAFLDAISLANVTFKRSPEDPDLLTTLCNLGLDDAYNTIPNNAQNAKKYLKDYMDDLEEINVGTANWTKIIARYKRNFGEFINPKFTLPEELRFGGIKSPVYTTLKQNWLQFGIAYISDDPAVHSTKDVSLVLNDFRYQNLTAIVCAERVVFGINSSATRVVALINKSVSDDSKKRIRENLKQISGRSGRFSYESCSIMEIF